MMIVETTPRALQGMLVYRVMRSAHRNNDMVENVRGRSMG